MMEFLREHETAFTWLIAASIVTFVVSLIAVPILVVRIPAGYFTDAHHRPRLPLHGWPALVRVAVLVLKNLLGAVFLGAGILMLFLPGQGIITMLIGIGLLNFPGKYELERWIVRRPSVYRSINWIRRRAGRGDLVRPS